MPLPRRDFLRFTGIAGVTAIWPFGRLSAQSGSGACVLIPTETAGPFPLDLTYNTFYLRTDIREDRAGTPLNLKMKILGEDNCTPMPNVRVHIWHCDKDGNYSGYGSETGLTYLRGYQITDANGEVNFITIFPGWYPGRTGHIHFQVYVNSSYAAISQLTWNHAAKNNVYLTYPDIYTDGIDPVTPESDGIFADGYAYQLASLEELDDIDGYASYLEVTVKGSGTTGFLEMQSDKYCMLAQNIPNPFASETIISFTLHQTAETELVLFNTQGKLVKQVLNGLLPEGNHSIPINCNDLPKGNYFYQLVMHTDKKIYSLPKVLTIA